MSDDNVTPILTARKANPDGDKPKKRQVRKINGPMSGAKAITAAQKTARAIELRLRNYPLAAIAEEVGYADESGAWKAIMRGLAQELPEAQRDQLRRVEIAKVNAIETAAWPAATLGNLVYDREGEVVMDSNGDPVREAPSDKAQSQVLKCIGLRAKLQGLEAPQQVVLSTREGEPVEVSVTHSLDPAFIAAAEMVRSRIMQQSIARAGEAIDV